MGITLPVAPWETATHTSEKVQVVKIRTANKSQPIVIFGRKFASINKAALALGLERSGLCKAIRRNQTEEYIIRKKVIFKSRRNKD